LATLTLRGLGKRFGPVDAVTGIDLDIADHEFVARAEITERVAARLLEIEPLLSRAPRQLSGGQRQRVASEPAPMQTVSSALPTTIPISSSCKRSTARKPRPTS
jgi:ABC-type sugar transport system ATPase subunit